LSLRREPNGTHEEIGKTWFEYSRFHPERFVGVCITYAQVATLNHFTFDDGGKVFNQTAPLIKLLPGAQTSDYFGLLGLLNSSVASFWAKQVMYNKGSTVDQQGARQTTSPFENFYAFDGLKLGTFPVAAQKPVSTTEATRSQALRVKDSWPESILARSKPLLHLKHELSEAHKIHRGALESMISLQEELDWFCYSAYGIVRGGTQILENPPPIRLGQRAFEIVMARKMERGELETTWFARHGSTPTTKIPEDWPADYRKRVEARIKLIEMPNALL
jgi:hypothetical protein